MAFVEMSFRSQILNIDTNICAILPEKRYEKEEFRPDHKYPVVYALHGFSDNQTSWIRKSNIELIARELEVIIVMPFADNGFYVNGKYTGEWFTYMSEELPLKVANFFPASTKREDTFIMGNSMGGYGAFRLVMGKPDKYAAAVSFSGILGLDYSETNFFMGYEGGRKMMHSVFGDEQEWRNSDNNLFRLAEKLDNYSGEKPRLYHLCGVDDPITYQSGKSFIDYCQSHTSLNIKYDESQGDHDWVFWTPYVRKAFEFFGFDTKTKLNIAEKKEILFHENF